MSETLITDREIQGLIPPLTKDEHDLLCESLLTEGCRDALVVWAGKDILLDGHNRYGFCQAHSIPFQVKELAFDIREDAINWVINNQLGRRNLTPEAVSYLRGKRYNAEKRQDGGHGDQKSVRQSDGPISRHTAEQLAEEFKVSTRTVERDGKFAEAVDTVAEAVGDEVKRDILSRDAKFTKKDTEKLAEVAQEDPEKARRVVDKVVNGEAKTVTAAKRQVIKEDKVDPPPLEGKYRVFYADPPWKYGNAGIINDDNYGHVNRHYPSMNISELCAMGEEIKGVSEENAVLFLWVTSPLLEDCFKVIKAWGFEYKTSFVWDKVKHNFGYYNSVRHEFLLVCTRGSCTPDVSKLFDSVQVIERSDVHSEKPERFREIIDTLYPSGNRIELFARKVMDGWDCWGNEGIGEYPAC